MSDSLMALSETCELITDGTHYTPKNIGHGTPFVTVKNMRNGSLDFAECSFISDIDFELARKNGAAPEVGDVLFSKDGTVGKVHLVRQPRPFAVLSSIAILRPNRKFVSPEYLAQALKLPDVTNQALRSKTGSAIRRIILSDLERIRIPVPNQLQQERIATILDTVSLLVSKREEALVKIDFLTLALFSEMFGDAAHPRECHAVDIAEICSVKGGKRLPKGEEYSSTPTPYRYIRVLDLRAGRVDEENLVYLTPAVQSKIKRYTVNEGDVIISIAGTIGQVAPVPRSLHGANLTENAAKLVPKRENIYDPVFLAFVLGLPSCQQQIKSHIGQVTIGKLALFRIEKLRVPLPSITRQREFTRRLQSIDAARNAHLKSRATLMRLLSSLQHRAFRGEL